MRINLNIITFLILLGSLNFFWMGCENNPSDNSLVFTELTSSEVSHFPSQAYIAIAEIDKPSSKEVLTSDFVSASAPFVSYDGSRLLFAGLHSGDEISDDIWQIWEMNLQSRKTTQITSSSTNCTAPAYLPDGRIVYSCEKEGIENSFAVYVCNADGTEASPLTFQPHADFPLTILEDGRILLKSKQVFPEEAYPKLLALRPDGTKAELYYRNAGSEPFSGKAGETGGRLFFVEAGELVAISTNRPLHSRQVLSKEGRFRSVSVLSSDELIVSCRPSDQEPYGLYVFDLVNNTLGEKLIETENNIVEVAMLAPRPVPRKLPTIVNTAKSSGHFVCMDANRSDIPAEGTASKVQVFGMEGLLGETALEADGSFYIEVPSDIPVRFQTVTDAGEVVRSHSSWLWVRPSERRGCVGCHADRELSPENIVPLSIEKPPVSFLDSKSSADLDSADH